MTQQNQSQDACVIAHSQATERAPTSIATATACYNNTNNNSNDDDAQNFLAPLTSTAAILAVS